MNIIFLDIDGVLNSLPYFKSMKDTDEIYNEISDFHLKKISRNISYVQCGDCLIIYMERFR